MGTDLGLEATRAIREKISREHDDDPRRLVTYYVKLQQRFADRLRSAPGPEQRRSEPDEPADAPGAAAPRE